MPEHFLRGQGLECHWLGNAWFLDANGPHIPSSVTFILGGDPPFSLSLPS